MPKLDYLFFAAHPDDVELACGGTILSEIATGKRIGIIDLTRGELGSRGNAEIRAQESQAATKFMGLSLRENLGLADGFFEINHTSRQLVIEQIRHLRPEIVIANAPSDRHPDHQRASKLVQEACFLAGLKNIISEYAGQTQTAFRPQQLLYYIQDQYLEPDFIIEIPKPIFERKMQLLSCYKSQFFHPNYQSQEAQTYISNPHFIEVLRSRAVHMGHLIGAEYGEGFLHSKKVGLRSLQDLSLHPF